MSSVASTSAAASSAAAASHRQRLRERLRRSGALPSSRSALSRCETNGGDDDGSVYSSSSAFTSSTTTTRMRVSDDAIVFVGDGKRATLLEHALARLEQHGLRRCLCADEDSAAYATTAPVQTAERSTAANPHDNNNSNNNSASASDKASTDDAREPYYYICVPCELRLTCVSSAAASMTMLQDVHYHFASAAHRRSARWMCDEDVDVTLQSSPLPVLPSRMHDTSAHEQRQPTQRRRTRGRPRRRDDGDDGNDACDAHDEEQQTNNSVDKVDCCSAAAVTALSTSLYARIVVNGVPLLLSRRPGGGDMFYALPHEQARLRRAARSRRAGRAVGEKSCVARADDDDDAANKNALLPRLDDEARNDSNNDSSHSDSTHVTSSLPLCSSEPVYWYNALSSLTSSTTHRLLVYTRAGDGHDDSDDSDDSDDDTKARRARLHTRLAARRERRVLYSTLRRRIAVWRTPLALYARQVALSPLPSSPSSPSSSPPHLSDVPLVPALLPLHRRRMRKRDVCMCAHDECCRRDSNKQTQHKHAQQQRHSQHTPQSCHCDCHNTADEDVAYRVMYAQQQPLHVCTSTYALLRPHSNSATAADGASPLTCAHDEGDMNDGDVDRCVVHNEGVYRLVLLPMHSVSAWLAGRRQKQSVLHTAIPAAAAAVVVGDDDDAAASLARARDASHNIVAHNNNNNSGSNSHTITTTAAAAEECTATAVTAISAVDEDSHTTAAVAPLTRDLLRAVTGAAATTRRRQRRRHASSSSGSRNRGSADVSDSDSYATPPSSSSSASASSYMSSSSQQRDSGSGSVSNESA